MVELRVVRVQILLEAATCYSLIKENQGAMVIPLRPWKNLPFDFIAVVLREVHDKSCVVRPWISYSASILPQGESDEVGRKREERGDGSRLLRFA
jgi:hypothetical protein